MDVTNWNCVSVARDQSIMIQRQPIPAMNKKDALLFAAWIVVLAEETDGDFDRILEEVKNV